MLASNARSNRDFSYFDKLSTEELREIIRQDSLLDENEDSDIDAILYITEVIANREKEENERNVKDVEAAWKSFKENYYPYISDPEPLYSFDSPKIKSEGKASPSQPYNENAERRRCPRSRNYLRQCNGKCVWL